MGERNSARQDQAALLWDSKAWGTAAGSEQEQRVCGELTLQSLENTSQKQPRANSELGFARCLNMETSSGRHGALLGHLLLWSPSLGSHIGDSNSFFLDVLMTLLHPSKHLNHSLKPRDVCFSSKVFRPQNWDSLSTAKTQRNLLTLAPMCFSEESGIHGDDGRKLV